MQKYFGNYRGIVIQSGGDPEFLNRLKVWVPSLNAALYEGFAKNRDIDKKITGLGENLESSLTAELLDRLRIQLPWAIIKNPIFGMSNSGTTYHADKNFSSTGNCSDSSTQSKVINKTLPATSNQTSVAQALQDNSSSSNSSAPPSSSSTSYPEYIRNAATTQSTTSPTNVVKTSSKSTARKGTDNIAGVQITYELLGNKTLKNRRFSTSFTLEDSSGILNSKSVLSKAGITTNSKYVPYTNTTSDLSVPKTAPIYYAPKKAFIADTENSDSKIISSSPSDYNVQVEFLPNKRGQKIFRKRRFTTSSTLLVYKDGQLISSNNEKLSLSTGKPVLTIDKKTITNINIILHDPSKSVDFTSPRLGQLGTLLQEYTNVPKGPSSSPNMPPSVISEPSYNAGGSGSNMNQLSYSNLLPFDAIKKSLIGGKNPNSISQATQGTQPDEHTDPKKTKHPGTQTPQKNPMPMRSSTQGDKAKGMISIPAVGAHVNVTFENGDYMFPIVDGVFYSQEDIMGVHDVS